MDVYSPVAPFLFYSNESHRIRFPLLFTLNLITSIRSNGGLAQIKTKKKKWKLRWMHAHTPYMNSFESQFIWAILFRLKFNFRPCFYPSSIPCSVGIPYNFLLECKHRTRWFYTFYSWLFLIFFWYCRLFGSMEFECVISIPLCCFYSAAFLFDCFNVSVFVRTIASADK